MKMVKLFLVFLFIIDFDILIAFHYNLNTKMAVKRLNQNLLMNEVSKVAIIGSAGGVCETVTSKLIDIGIPTKLLINRSPYSPVLRGKEDSRSSVLLGDFEKNMAISNSQSVPINTFLENSIIIVSDDDGDENLVGPRNNGESEAEKIMMKLLSILPKSIKSVICTSKVSSESDNKLSLFFRSRPSEAYKKWCEQNNVPYLCLQYGQLIGGISGCEPTPFLGMPLLEPEIHPSYVLRSVVLSDSKTNKYASTEPCTRESLSEAIIQILQQNILTSLNQLSVETLIISIIGQPLKQAEWKQLFNRISNSNNIEISKIQFQEILKPQLLINWIADSWFPQALIEADAATILTGARPVRAIKTSSIENGKESLVVKILWEDLQPDLTVKPVGYLEISLSDKIVTDSTENYPSLNVKRIADKPLPGETQLTDKLIEGINKSVYKKQFCKPLESFPLLEVPSTVKEKSVKTEAK